MSYISYFCMFAIYFPSCREYHLLSIAFFLCLVLFGVVSFADVSKTSFKYVTFWIFLLHLLSVYILWQFKLFWNLCNFVLCTVLVLIILRSLPFGKLTLGWLSWNSIRNSIPKILNLIEECRTTICIFHF